MPDPGENLADYLCYTGMLCGIPFLEAENMSGDELSLATLAKQERTKEFSQLLAWLVYNGAALCSVAVNEPKRFPKLEEAFPSLFHSEENGQQDWRVMKERIERYSKLKTI